MIRILIVDDQKTIRESIKAWFAEVSDFQVVGTATDGYEAIAQVKELQPDIILIDIEMPNLDGLEATKRISQQHSKIKILILTNHDKDDLIAQFLYAGAEGYLLKNMASQEIIRAIRFVSQGYTEIRPSIGIKGNTSNLVNDRLPQISSLSNSDSSSQITPAKEDTKLSSLRLATPNQFLPPIKNWLVISGLACLGIFTGAIVISSWLEYKVTVKAPAKIRPIGELRIVQAATAGKIASILVTENQQVQSGELIARIDDARLQSQKQQLLGNIQQVKQQLTQLNNQIVSIQAQIAAQKNLQQRNLASAQAKLRHQQRLYQEQLITTEARVQEAQAAVELAQEELNRYQELVQTGIISELQLKEKEAALKTSIARLQQMKASLNPSSGEVEMAREQIAQELARGQATLASLDREQRQLNERQTEIYNQLSNYQEELNQVATELNNTLIHAPLSGIIQVLNLRNQGQVVSPGDKIATIAPINSSLEIKAAVASQDIDKVEVGQTAQMRVSACPYSDFGTLMGTVITISPDTLNSQSQTEEISSDNSSYEISIQPESFKLHSGSRSCTIRSGMEGKVDIISRKETVLKFILRKAKLIANTDKK
ncbi:MAG: response regulator [Xenococcus sp. MO_188.B8]|nr:response regulator [Xenococcus sp. MO_188.B8]